MDIYCDSSTKQACILYEGAAQPYFVNYVDRVTNNVGEYLALLEVLRNLWLLEIKQATIFTDSLLVVNQINGLYACRQEHLKPFLEEAKRLIQATGCEVKWIPREENPAGELLEMIAHQRYSP